MTATLNETLTCQLDTPMGVLRLSSDGDSLIAIDLPAGSKAASAGSDFTSTRSLPSSLLREATRQLKAYFDGKLRTFDLPLAPALGTDFQRRVWRELENIPYGQTISYAELARRIGQPAASRAVGAANGKNPLPIVVPCHRVIGADGTLTGYGGGLPIKKWLLEHEGVASR